MIRFAALITATTLLTGASLAGTDVKLPAFSSIDLHGGGEVRLLSGPVQRVTVIKGDVGVAEIEVRGNSLELAPCKGLCMGWHNLVVEIVTPTLEGLEVHGGGSISAQGNFPKMAHLKAQIHGGGDADLRAIAFDAVDADVHGGGELRIQAINTLNATIHGGGEIHYVGHPAHINSQTHGGGEIHGE